MAPQPFVLNVPDSAIADLKSRLALTRLPEAAYTRESSDQVYDEIFGRARKVLAQGHSAILDAAFLTEAERAAAAEIARTAGIDFRGLFLTAASEVRVQRIGSRRGDASDATEAVALGQEAIDTGAIDWPLIDASGTPNETLARATPLFP